MKLRQSTCYIHMLETNHSQLFGTQVDFSAENLKRPKDILQEVGELCNFSYQTNGSNPLFSGTMSLNFPIVIKLHSVPVASPRAWL